MKDKLTQFLLEDDDFKNAYNSYNVIDSYDITIKTLINYICDEIDLYTLDKKYLDVSYVIINDTIIDLDGVFDFYESNLKDYA